MSTQTISRQVQWQDLKVRSELDVVFEIAAKEGWKDCEVFGHGEMITQPQESTGWKLIPADVYKYNIPPEAVKRLYQVINAGVRVQGVIIADDGQRKERSLTPAKPKVTPSSVKRVVSLIGKALLGLICVAGVIAITALVVIALIHVLPIIMLGSLFCLPFGMTHDPKLVVLVDDGNGATTWVSLFTWYD